MAYLSIEDKILKKVTDRNNLLKEEILELSHSIEKLTRKLAVLEQSAPDHYKKTVGNRNKVSEIKNKVEERQKEIETLYNSLQEGFELSTTLQEQVSSIINKIKINEEQSETISKAIASDYESYKQVQGDIEDTLLELNKLIDVKSSLSHKIESISDQVDESEVLSKRLKSMLISATKERKEISDLYSEVFGFVYTNEDGEEIREEGLQAELEQTYSKIKDDLAQTNSDVINLENSLSDKTEKIENQFSEKLNSFIDNAEQQKVAIIEQIRSLLPDSLTAGLSGAYIDKIAVEKEQLEKHEESFDRSIIGLIACSSLPVIFSMARVLFLGADFTDVLKDVPMLYSMMLPVYAPILWVAYSANKSYKLSKRLIEEYTHKEVSSRTFEGLSNQISNIGENDTNNELRTKLLFNLLQVNSENPGKLISDYNKSDHPIIDAIDKSSKLADAINKLDNVPLVGQLLKHLNAKEQVKLKQKAENMANAFEVQKEQSDNIQVCAKEESEEKVA